MRSLIPTAALLSLALALAASPAAAQAPYYLFTNCHCSDEHPCNNPGNFSRHDLYDDGLHGDGAAGDGIVAVDVPSTVTGGCRWFVSPGWNPTYGDYWPAWPGYPWNPFYTPIPARAWPSGPGDVIHFVDTGGWVATDHAVPGGTIPSGQFFLGDFQFGPPPFFAVPTSKVGSIWEATLDWANASSARYGFLASIPGNPTIWFNNGYNSGGTGEGAFPGFQTSGPAHIILRFDESTGAITHTIEAPTATARDTWGAIKILYR